MFKINENTARKLIKETRFEKIDKEIKAIGGIKYFNIIEIKDAVELVSFCAMALGIIVLLSTISLMNSGNIKTVALGFIGFTSLILGQYFGKIRKYKEKIMSDTELPLVLQTIANAAEVGIPLENAIRHVVKTKKGIVRDLLNEAIAKSDVGYELEASLKIAAEKSLNRHFIVFARSLNQAKKTRANIKELLLEQIDEINEEKETREKEKAASMGTKLFFPIFAGYFVPTGVLLCMPVLLNLKGLNLGL